MNCQRFEDIVTDIAREQILEVNVRNEAIAHSGECSPCALRLEDELAITQWLKNFSGSTESMGASAQVEAELLAAFGNQPQVKSHAALTSRPRYWIAAIAAVLVVVFAFAVFRGWQAAPRRARAGDQLAVKVGAPTNPAPSQVNPVIDEGDSTPPAIHWKRTLTLQHNRRAVKSIAHKSRPAGDSEIATDFIPVTYGGVASLFDGGRMVRVELPRSAMASFGLPVNIDRANEKIKADVLLGVDGLAHAIRFVR